MTVLDLAADAHVHTAFSVGRDGISEMVTAADRAGLTALTIADRVDSGSSWLAEYRRAVRRAEQRVELRVCLGVQVEVVRDDGWLGFPVSLAGLDLVSVAVSRLPLASGLADADEIRARLDAGSLRPTDVVELLVGTVILGIERAGRYAPVQLARPLALLGAVGVAEPGPADPVIDALARACVETGARIEVSEHWRVPSPQLVNALAGKGVRLVAASDAHRAADVGQWHYLRAVAAHQPVA
jgi:putative hydrolase